MAALGATSRRGPSRWSYLSAAAATLSRADGLSRRPASGIRAGRECSPSVRQEAHRPRRRSATIPFRERTAHDAGRASLSCAPRLESYGWPKRRRKRTRDRRTAAKRPSPPPIAPAAWPNAGTPFGSISDRLIPPATNSQPTKCAACRTLRAGLSDQDGRNQVLPLRSVASAANDTIVARQRAAIATRATANNSVRTCRKGGICACCTRATASGNTRHTTRMATQTGARLRIPLLTTWWKCRLLLPRRGFHLL